MSKQGPRRGKGIDPQMRALIEKRINQGLPNRVISTRTGVHETTISSIRVQLKKLGEKNDVLDDNRFAGPESR